MITFRCKYLQLIAGVFAVGLSAIICLGDRSGEPPDSGKAAAIIFDTDIGTDVDDAGALAILHIMADRGEAEILATVSANRNRWCAPALDAINTYYGRGDTPIGCSRTGPGPEEWYHSSVGDFPHDLTDSNEAPDAVALYRKILAARPDNSVTIVVVGWLTNMAELLESKPDKYSPLAGRELVKAKVNELVSMGGKWPNLPKDEGEYNFTMDGAAAHKVISDWPGRIMFTGLGKDVMTGGRLVAEGSKDNPVPAFYRNFFENYKVSERSSWDLIAVLYAIRGASDYFTAVSDGKCVSKEDGSNQWLPGVPSNHAYLDYNMPPGQLAAVLEDLLLTAPSGRKYNQKTEKELRDIIGITHVDGKYFLTGEDFLNEGAGQILALGSRVIKVWFHNPQKSYSFNSNWPEMNSLVEIAKSPYFKELFDKPFTTYVLMCFSTGRHEAYWRKGVTEKQKLDEQRQFYELTKYLLTTYKASRKTFVLQHWEGDWLIRGNYDSKADPTPEAISGMIEWLNARQDGVNQARKEIRTDGIRVYHAAEVNRVVDSMKNGKPNMVNKVLPHTSLDLVSYSAWDSTTAHPENPQVFRDTLDFIAANMPDSPDFGDRNVYVGEFGMPENKFSTGQIQQMVPSVVKAALDWGCPYIIYWQLYCNELQADKASPPVHSNNAVRGFWLIRPDGSRPWTWEYFSGLLSSTEHKIR